MFNLDDCIGFITNTGAKILSEEFNKRAQEHGMTRVQWIALYYIGKEDGVSQKEISEYMSVKESSMVRLIDRMEKDGLVERKKDPNDRRIARIILTKKGEELRNQSLYIGKDFQNDVTIGITEEELNNFKNVLNKMTKNIK